MSTRTGAVLVVVLDGDLGLAVGTQVVERAVLAHLGQPLGEPVRDGDRQRHQLGGVVGGVAEHQALVARALLVERVVGGADPCLVAVVDSLGDVGGLAADGHLDAARLTVEALVGRVVADLEDLRADQLGNRRVGVGAHLTGHHDEPGRQQRLHGDAELLLLGVVLEEVVEHGVADRVGDLVGVTLGHRLRGEQTSGQLLLLLRDGVWGWIVRCVGPVVPGAVGRQQPI